MPLADANNLHYKIGVQRGNIGGIYRIHSGQSSTIPEAVVEQSGMDDGSGQVEVKKRKKLKGKRAVVKWLKFFRYKKKKAYERMTPEEKILFKMKKVEIFIWYIFFSVNVDTEERRIGSCQ